MPQAYSNDFRQKLVQAIEENRLSKSEASRLFKISRNTIHLWLKRKAETGDIQPKPRTGGSQRRIIQDWEQFRAFAREHSDKTQEEMASLWKGQISSRTMSRALRQIGFTRKKNLWVSREE